LALALLTCPLTVKAQVAVQPKAPGIEANDYIWNEVKDDALLALRASADAKRGAATYKLCHGCHQAGGVGSSDGLYPRLAGQHDTVLIKQLVDIRLGRRDNPTMFPFASEREISTQDVADLALYLSELPTPSDNAKGSGNARALVRGAKLFAKDCASCHGKKGQGVAEKFYPRLAGQHFPYLQKEIRDIATGTRRNANPKMVAVVKDYSDAEMTAVADYLSRLPRPKKR
jgi:cytochrome c553